MGIARNLRRLARKQDAAAVKQTRRKAMMEPLEPRLLLSADLATSGVLGALDSGSDLFADKLGAFVDTDPQLDTRVPFVVESKINPADSFDILATSPQLRDLLSVIVDVNRDGTIQVGAEQSLDLYDTDNDGKVELMEVLSPLLSQKLIADYQADDDTPTMGEFLSYVDGLDTSISSGNYGFSLQLSNATDTSTANQVSFSFDVSLTFNQDLAFDLGTVADAYSIGLGKDALLHVTSSLAFNVEMGVFTSGETPGNSDFFVDAGPLDFDFSVGGTNLSFPDLTIGFLGVSATGGTASIDAHIIASLTDPTSAEKLGFTSAQFGDSNIGSITAANALNNADFGGMASLFVRIGAGDTKEVSINTTGFNTDNLTGITSAVQTALNAAGYSGQITAGIAGGKLVLTLASPASSITVNSAVSYSDLNTQPTEDLLASAFVDTPSASVNLPITVDAGIGYSASTSIAISVPDITLVSPVSLEDGDLRFGLSFTPSGDFNEMLQFSNISAGSIIGLIRQLGSWFSSYENTSDFTDYKIPYTDASLGEVLDYADLLFDKLLIDDLDDGNDATYGTANLLKYENNSLVTTFGTAQQLADPAITNYLTNANYDPSTNRLTYNVNLNKIFTYDLPVDFRLDLSPLMNIDSSADIQLTSNGWLAFTLGFDLGGPTTLAWETPLIDLNNGKGVSIKQEAAVTAPSSPVAVYGRLTSDAHLTLTIGGTDYLVTITSASTSTNMTAADLAADINDALVKAREIVGGSVSSSYTDISYQISAADVGNKIKLESTASFTVTTTDNDTARKEIGFAASASGTSVTTTKDLSSQVGALSGDPSTLDTATFDIVVDGTTYNISLDVSETVYNRTIVDLINDLNKAIVAAGCTVVTVTSQGQQLVFTAVDASTSFSIENANTAAQQMGLNGTTLVSNDADFIIHVSSGTPSSFSIYLDGLDLDSDDDGSDDLGGIKAAIEAQTSGKVTVEFNEALNGLRLVETGFNAAGSDFKVTGVNASPAALSLGILKSDVMPNSTEKKDGKIEGGPLGGTTLADRMFLQNANLTAGISLNTTDVEATAQFGIVSIKLSGTPNLSANMTALLKDPNSDGIITLTELKTALGTGGDPSSVIAAPAITGTSNTTFNVTVNPAVLSLAGGSVSVNIADVANPVPSVNIAGLNDRLEKFASLGMDDILASLDTLIGFLKELETFQIMGYELPLINRSMSDIVGYASKFEAALANFKSNPAATLQQLESFLESSFGGGNLITLEYFDAPGSDPDMLKVKLADSISFNKSMNIEIPDLTPRPGSRPPGHNECGFGRFGRFEGERAAWA